MIEGLRALPWLQERIRNNRRDVDHILDCDVCRGLKPSNTVRATTQIQRQCFGCPYEPPRPDLGFGGWTHPGYTDEPPTTCPGYTAKLPEVIEINRARLHWKHGHLREFCDGAPTEVLQRGIEILEGAANEANCWRPEDKK